MRLHRAVCAQARPTNAAPVFRFFDNVTGTHFFTTSASEAANVAATRHDMTQEAPTVFEHLTQQTGDQAVYRFVEQTDGTHFYTNSATESAGYQRTMFDAYDRLWSGRPPVGAT